MGRDKCSRMNRLIGCVLSVSYVINLTLDSANDYRILLKSDQLQTLTLLSTALPIAVVAYRD